MAYTTIRNELAMRFRDERSDLRVRTIELGGLIIVTDDDAAEWDAVSKSMVRGYTWKNNQLDAALVADADSEVSDTLRLYFLMPDDNRGHLDIVDPLDSLFLSTTGPGANILRDYADLAAGVTPEDLALTSIIDKCLVGSILISDGEQAVTFLEGIRL